MTQGKTFTEIRPRFVVDTPPFMHRGYTVNAMMRDMLIALAPAAAAAIWQYGIEAFRVMALAAGICVLTQSLWEKALGRQSRVFDGSALVTGVLFAFLLPAGAPWWLVATGSALTVILGREVFGGIGCNPLCPPLVGWAAMTVSWPVYMDPTAVNLSSSLLDPLIRMKYYGWTALSQGSEMALLLGGQLGGLGSAQIAAVLAGGLYLLVRGVVRWEIPAACLAGVLITGAVFWRFGPAMGIGPASAPPPHLYLLTGSTIFVAFFLATEHSSSPVAVGGMFAYGLLAGFLTVLIRIFGMYPDGAPFAVLLTSLGTPMFDLIRAAPFGGKRS
ncbi:MAG: RnfABCDGE type electron transport complex subunit D [Desulfovibrio sp.]|jgi:electron transport complex protein RnfD|nr:RnfABCDGE type electron transport complex subunit D [Desulfovibrio sp.]